MEAIEAETEMELDLGGGRRFVWNITNRYFKVCYSLDSHCEVGFVLLEGDTGKLAEFMEEVAFASR